MILIFCEMMDMHLYRTPVGMFIVMSLQIAAELDNRFSGVRHHVSRRSYVSTWRCRMGA